MVLQPLLKMLAVPPDLICRMRGLDYGHYERQKADVLSDPAWKILVEENKEFKEVDLELFTSELDDAVSQISQLVKTIFGLPPPSQNLDRSGKRGFLLLQPRHCQHSQKQPLQSKFAPNRFIPFCKRVRATASTAAT